MFAIIGSKEQIRILNEIASEKDTTIVFESHEKVIELLDVFEKINRMALKCLILNIDNFEDLDKLSTFIRRYKIKCEKTQIIIYYPNASVGNRFLSMMVTMGVYDILSPNSAELEYFDFKISILNLLEKPTGYSKAVRWDVNTSIESELSINKPKSTNFVEASDSKSSEKSFEKEKIEYIEKIAFFKTKTVAIVGATESSGSTFLTLNLASYISSFGIDVGIFELPQSVGIYDLLGFNEAFDNPMDFPSLHHSMDFNGTIEPYAKNNISFVVPNPNKEVISSKDWNQIKTYKLMTACKNSAVNLIDLGRFDADVINQNIDLFDTLIFVIDPYPQSLVKCEKVLSQLKAIKDRGLQVINVMNKWNGDIDKKVVLEFLEIKPLTYIPVVDLKTLYKSYYNCELPYMHFKSLLDAPLREIVHKALPQLDSTIESKLKQHSKKFSLFSKKH